MTRLADLRALSPRRRRLLAESLVLIALGGALLSVGSVRHARRALGGVTPVVTHLHRSAGVPVADLVWAVDTADSLVPGTGTCLRRALVATELLTVHDRDVTLRIGVATDGAGFAAHAWVEADDRVVVGGLPDLERFRPLPPDTIGRLSG